jgi:nitrite reductase/ring-hydroxylating ferredoxin subunit
MNNDGYIAPASDLPVGSVVGVDGFAVGNNGEHFAVSRRCRHLGADLAEGSLDPSGCLVCPGTARRTTSIAAGW